MKLFKSDSGCNQTGDSAQVLL